MKKIPVGNSSFVFINNDHAGRMMVDLALGSSNPGSACYSSKSIREKLIPLLSKIADEMDKPKFEPVTITVNTPEHAALLLGSIGPTPHDSAIQHVNRNLRTSFENTSEARDAVFDDFIKLQSALKVYGRPL